MDIKIKILISIVIVFAVFAKSEPIATVTEIEGQAQYRPAADTSNWVDLELNVPLFLGDKINVGKDSWVYLFFKTNEVEQVKGRTIYTLDSVPKETGDTKSRLADLWEAIENKFKRTYSEKRLGNYAGIRGETIESIPGKIISPKSTLVLSYIPVFEWTPCSSIGPYQLKIFDDTLLIWTGESDTNIANLNKIEDLFEYGREYSWVLNADIGLDVTLSDTATFRIVTLDEEEIILEELKRIENSYGTDNSTAEQFAKGLFFEQRGLNADALLSYHRYVELCNFSPTAVLVLADFYFELGFPSLAQRELLNAVEIPEELKNRW